jgi:hypothetical protein
VVLNNGAFDSKPFQIQVGAAKEIPVSAEGLMTHANQPQQAFGTDAAPYKVTLGGKMKADPSLKFEGVEFYKQFGTISNVMAFVFSIPKAPTASPGVTPATPAPPQYHQLDAAGLTVKFDDPVTADKSDPPQVVRTMKNLDKTTTITTITWLGWREGAVYAGDNNKINWSNGGSITKDLIAMPDHRNGEGASSFSNLASLTVSLMGKIEVNTKIQNVDGTVLKEDTQTYSGWETVVVRLVER